MTQSNHTICPQCGKELSADAPAGLCPGCVMKMNLSPETVILDSREGSPQSIAELAERLPQFDLIECLGRGGMGVVYRARQKTLDREVAIKLIAGERQEDAAFAERFAKEAKLLAQMNHPNIVTVHDFGDSNGLYYIVMEYIDGVNLRDVLSDGKMEPEQALAIVPSICDALEYAHGKGIVHRDIKPENLLMDREGRVKIADFGIAALVHADAEIAGTPRYMAPEQVHGKADRRADIYALGVVLYEMLTGELPGKSVEPPSKKVHVDARLDEIVLKALEKNPELRYQQASLLKSQIQTIVDEEEPSAGVSRTPARPGLTKANVREIVEHLTVTEKRALNIRGGLFGAWLFTGPFVLLFAALFTQNDALRIVLLVGIAVVYVAAILLIQWLTRQFLGTTTWAAQQGITPRDLPRFIFGAELAHHRDVSSGRSRQVFWFALIALLFVVGTWCLWQAYWQSREGRSVPKLAESPQHLRNANTADVISAAIYNPMGAWAWPELEKRKLTSDDTERVISGLEAWLHEKHPSGLDQPLPWADKTLEQMASRGDFTEDQKLRLLSAVIGELHGQRLSRLREGQTELRLIVEGRPHWHSQFLGYTLMNGPGSVFIDGEPIQPPKDSGRDCGWDSHFSNVWGEWQIPPLKAGKHVVRVEMTSALVETENVTGLPSKAPEAQWPRASKKWVRAVELPLQVIGIDEQPVSLSEDQALAPDQSISVKSLLSRPHGRLSQVAISLAFNNGTSIPLSCDVELQVEDQIVFCGPFTSELSEKVLTADVRPLREETKTATVALLPNAKHVFENASIDRIWGKEIRINDVPIKRLDLSAPTEETE